MASSEKDYGYSLFATSYSLLSCPSARRQLFAHMARHWRHDPHWRPVLADWHHDLARLQMQDRAAKARRGAIDVVADDRPAL
jgi:hypothetical protein